MSCSIDSDVMKTLSFHEGYKPLEGVSCIVKLVASSVKVELPLRKYASVKNILDGCWSNEKGRTTRARKINAHRVNETETAGNIEARQCEKLRSVVEVFLLNKKRVRWQQN